MESAQHRLLTDSQLLIDRLSIALRPPTMAATMATMPRAKRQKAEAPTPISKMDALQAGALGSRVAEFVEMKDKFALSRCSQHWNRVVAHPASWNTSLVLNSKMIRSMMFDQLQTMLNRTQLDWLTLDIDVGELTKERLILLDDWLNKVANALDSKFKIKKLTLLINQVYLMPWDIKLISTLPLWAKHIEALRIDTADIIDLCVADEKGNVLKLHTLELSGQLDNPRVLNLLTPTLRIFKSGGIASLDEKNFASTLSKMHLTTLDLNETKYRGNVIEFYKSLTEPLLGSVTSVMCSDAWTIESFKVFPNIKHLTISMLPDVKTIRPWFPQLERITYHNPPFSGAIADDFIVRSLPVTQSGSDETGSDRIRLDIFFGWKAQYRGYQVCRVRELKKMADAKGAKCVEVGEKTFVVEPK